MRRESSTASGVLLMGLALLLAGLPAAGQDGGTDGYTAPRTPWGDPDLEGIWSSKTTTPLERPDDYEGREFLTEDEITTLEANARQASRPS